MISPCQNQFQAVLFICKGTPQLLIKGRPTQFWKYKYEYIHSAKKMQNAVLVAGVYAMHYIVLYCIYILHILYFAYIILHICIKWLRDMLATHGRVKTTQLPPPSHTTQSH